MLKINLVLESKIWMIASRKMGNINPVTFMLPSHRRCSFSPHHDTKKKCQSFNFPFFSCWWRAYRRSIECKQSGDDQTDDVSPLVIQSSHSSWWLRAYRRLVLYLEAQYCSLLWSSLFSGECTESKLMACMRLGEIYPCSSSIAFAWPCLGHA